jgi:hypothetical protein
MIAVFLGVTYAREREVGCEDQFAIVGENSKVFALFRSASGPASAGFCNMDQSQYCLRVGRVSWCFLCEG